ncbi:MAG TPA: DUF5681 domain-containing protein [Rhodanobacteraceae bacterium]|nr:DUF5681 domain-containing protein [Rhodanobacteraceae bacterium]
MNHKIKPGWKPGQSGNPKGRPKGILNPQARLRKMINAEAIVKKLEEAALAGDVQAARTLLERALPIYRLTAEPVNVPAAATAATPTAKAQAVMDAIASGKIPPDIGAQLITAIGALVRVVEMDELERRIAALETAKGGTP